MPYYARSPAQYYMQQQQRRDQQMRNILNMFMQKQQMGQQQKRWEAEQALKEKGLEYDKMRAKAYTKAQEALAQQRSQPEPMSKWQYNLGLIDSIEKLSEQQKKLVALGAPVSNFIQAGSAGFSNNTIQKISNYTGIASKEIRGYSPKRQGKLFDAMIGRLDESDDTYKELQENYGQSIDTFITDLDQLIHTLESPVAQLSEDEKFFMKQFGSSTGLSLFIDPENQEKNKARAAYLKKMRNKLQGYSALASEWKLAPDQWRETKKLMSMYYENPDAISKDEAIEAIMGSLDMTRKEAEKFYKEKGYGK